MKTIYISHRLSCIFDHCDDVTCSNETLGFFKNYFVLFWDFVQSYLLGNYICDQNGKGRFW